LTIGRIICVGESNPIPKQATYRHARIQRYSPDECQLILEMCCARDPIRIRSPSKFRL
jgi:hypothetical protein